MKTQILKYITAAVGLLMLGAACSKPTVETTTNTSTELNTNVSVQQNSHTTGSFDTTPSNQN